MSREPARERPEEQTVYGVKACLALLEHRPQDLIRLYHHPSLRARLSAALSEMATRRLPYRELDEEGLHKVSKSTHHEGLVVVVRPLRYRPLPERWQTGSGARWWVALDGVENPHNLGAILRTCAFYGVSGVMVGGQAPGAKVNAAVLRVAEGGAEHVPLFAAPHLSAALNGLRQAGYTVAGLETDGTHAWWESVDAGRLDGPVVLVLGSESVGLSPDTRQACALICVLKGLGSLDSLNVSVATAVALTSLARACGKR